MDFISGMSKGAVTTTQAAGTAVTTTSNIVHLNGFNALLLKVDFTGSGAWTFKVQGCLDAAGPFVDWYDMSGAQMSTGSITADRGQLFVGVPNYIKIVATEDSGTATVTVKVQPIVV